VGAGEIALLVALNQVAQAGSAYLTRIASVPTSPYAKSAIAVGQQLCSAVVRGSAAGIAAANAEFATVQKQEAGVVAQLNGLPPIN